MFKASNNVKIPLSMMIPAGMNMLRYMLGPKEFPKRYLSENAPRTTESRRRDSLTLTDIAPKDFFIGAAVHDMDDPSFRQTIPGQFNSVTPANVLKWGNLLKEGVTGPYDFSKADRMVDYALEHGVRVRGHNLVWGKFPGEGFPADIVPLLNQAQDPQALLRKMLEEHVFTVLGHYRGRISTWDVVNEPFGIFGAAMDDHIFYQVLGKEYIPLIFQLSQQADPKITLYLNEQLHQYGDKRAKAFLKLIRELLDQNVPLHGIGIQSHITFVKPSLRELRDFLGDITSLGLDFEINELDVMLAIFRHAKDPYQAQGDFIRGFIETCLEFKNCKGITFWGICDRQTWMDQTFPFQLYKPNAPLLFDEEMNAKPAYYGIWDALKNRKNISPIVFKDLTK